MNTNFNAEAAVLDDVRLVELSRNGDRDAFGQLVQRHQSSLCAMTYSACGNVAQSEDLAQESFIVAWRKLDNLKTPGKFRPWLHGIARNIVNNSFRSQTRNPLATSEPLEEMLTPPATAANPGTHAITREEQELLWRAIEQIPANYRDPLVLFYREQQSIEKVAAALDISEDAARQRLSRGRKLLQEQMLAFVQGALENTGPGPAFTLGVIAAISSLSIPAKAATVGALLKGGATAKGAGLFGVAGAIAAPIFAFLGMWVDYRLRTRSGLTQIQLKPLRRYYVGLTIIVVVTIVLISALMTYAKSIITFSPALFAILLTGTLVVYPIIIGFLAKRSFSAIQTPIDDTSKLWGQGIDYRSKWTFLGIPLIHVRFGRRIDCVYSLPGWNNAAKGWIAISDSMAFGGLFAYAGMAFAPLSIGPFSLGLLAYGGLAIGAISVAGFSFGVWAFGAFSFGWQAMGGTAIGWDIANGSDFAIARHYALGNVARAAQVNTEFVRTMVKSNSFFAFCWFHLLPHFLWLMSLWCVPLMGMVIYHWRRVIRLKK